MIVSPRPLKSSIRSKRTSAAFHAVSLRTKVSCALVMLFMSNVNGPLAITMSGRNAVSCCKSCRTSGSSSVLPASNSALAWSAHSP